MLGERREGVAFGSFHLYPKQRLLLQDGASTPLRGREFDLLVALVSRAGEFLTNDELTAIVWPSTIVSDANLRVQMASLRRALGDGRGNMRYVINVAGRGYCFAAPTRLVTDWTKSDVEETSVGTSVAPAESRRRHNLPSRRSNVIGREEAVHRLVANVPERRLITVVGPGGVGKTTLALTVAEQMADQFSHGAWLVDLAPLSDPSLVSSAVASALGLSVVPEEAGEAIAAFLASKRLLLVVDNCEHVIEAAAAMIDRVLLAARGVHVLATSRETLRLGCEWAFRLGALETPPLGADLAADHLLAYPAAQLFVERAWPGDTTRLDTNHAALIGEICRKVDGSPLALELAAARASAFGLVNLAERLDGALEFLTKGHRTATPRHQTLRAMFDWSYDLLSRDEQRVLARLSIFRGEFDSQAAAAVCADDDLPAGRVMEALSGLSAKSLLATHPERASSSYRLLVLTRAYAAEKLAASSDANLVARRHALHFQTLLHDAVASYGDAQAVWMETQIRIIDDVRAALDWAFSPSGDERLAIVLTRAAIQPGLRLSLFSEYARRIDSLLARSVGEGALDPATRIYLLVERMNILQHTTDDPRMRRALTSEVATLAATLADTAEGKSATFDSLVLAFGDAFSEGRAPDMLRLAQEVLALDQSLSGDGGADAIRVTGERMLAQARHFQGDHAAAASLVDRVLRYPPALMRPSRSLQADRLDPRITLRIFQARIDWLQGRPHQAVAIAHDAVELASQGYGHGYCYALAMASYPVAIWRGDLASARDHLTALGDHAASAGFDYWGRWAQQLRHALDVIEGRAGRGGLALENPLHLDHLATFHPSFSTASALRRVEDGLAQWCAPEVLRAYAECHVADGRLSLEAAGAMLSRSFELARRQNAVAWQLRTATTLARLWDYQGRREEACELLGPVLDQFDEGLNDNDFVSAEALLRKLAAH